jgi:tetratricopeptide (TPR) repeat protein
MALKIAVYAIALNEAKHAAQWAEVTQGADYRLVADTGSTDGTQEILRQNGVNVFDISVRPWRFDMARNASLALIPQEIDICLFLDLDEIPEPKFFDKVRAQWVEGKDHGWINFNTGNTWHKDKIHSRHGWIWKYPCHEVAVFYGGEVAKHCMIDALITHKPDETKSRGQYIPLLELAVKELPQDPRMWAYMTREYYFHQRWDDVLRAGQAMLDCPNGWDVEQAAVCKWLGEAEYHLGNIENSTKWFERGAEILPKQGEPWYGVAIDAYRRRDWSRCLGASINAIETPRSNHYCYEAAIWDWKAYDLAGISAYNLGLFAESKTFTEMALKAVPDGPERERIKRNLEFSKDTLKRIK